MSDSVAIIIALIAVVPPTVLGYLSFRASKSNAAQLSTISINIDGRLTELLDQKDKTAAAEVVNAHAAGKVEGKAEGA